MNELVLGGRTPLEIGAVVTVRAATDQHGRMADNVRFRVLRAATYAEWQACVREHGGGDVQAAQCIFGSYFYVVQAD